jgi:hypothetical protein
VVYPGSIRKKVRRECWWCSLGANVGREQDGKNRSFERPVLIFRKFSRETFFGMPISGSVKAGKHYFPFSHDGADNVIIMSQLRLLDSKRLLQKMDVLPEDCFYQLEKCFDEFLLQTKEKPPVRAESQNPIVSPPVRDSEAEAIVNPS